jgi:hypothetical protein
MDLMMEGSDKEGLFMRTKNPRIVHDEFVIKIYYMMDGI